MEIRKFNPSDTNQIAQLFHDTIRSVNIGDYSEEQVKAWAPDDIHFRDWEEQCSSRYTLVAKKNGVITGFAQLEDNGHIDCFYCYKDFQGQGVGSMLYKSLEKRAQKIGISRLNVEASITAKPFFGRMGFALIKKQAVTVRGVELTNYKMEKYLGN